MPVNINTLKYPTDVNKNYKDSITKKDWNRLIEYIASGVNYSNSRGYYATALDLPSDAANGDIALVGSTETIWRHDGTQWIDTLVPGLTPSSQKKMVIPLSAETGQIPTGLLYSFGFDTDTILYSATLSANVAPEDAAPGGLQDSIIIVIRVGGVDLPNDISIPSYNFSAGLIPMGNLVTFTPAYLIGSGVRVDILTKRVGDINTGEGLKLILAYE